MVPEWRPQDPCTVQASLCSCLVLTQAGAGKRLLYKRLHNKCWIWGSGASLVLARLQLSLLTLLPHLSGCGPGLHGNICSVTVGRTADITKCCVSGLSHSLLEPLGLQWQHLCCCHKCCHCCLNGSDGEWEMYLWGALRYLQYLLCLPLSF